MKKVLFDLKVTQPRFGSKRHGGGKYGEIVLRRIIERGLPVNCYFDSCVWLNPEIKQLCNDYHIPLYDLASDNLRNIIEANDISRVFVPANLVSSSWRNLDTEVFGVVHGMRGVELTDLPKDLEIFRYRIPTNQKIKEILKLIIPHRKLVERSIRKARENFIVPNVHIITVSNHSAFAMRNVFPDLDFNIPVFYSPSTSAIETKDRVYTDKYFLIVSANRPEKNPLRAIEAIDRLISNGLVNGIRVKVTGVKDASFFKYKLENRDCFDFLGFVDEKELDQLYHDAYCFIYPTLNEGFGYPPLEAMHYGIPVLTSALTAVPEVCGGNVIYFNPYSIEEIMNRILMILDSDIHEKFSKLSNERYKYITNKQYEDLDRLIDYLYDIKR